MLDRAICWPFQGKRKRRTGPLGTPKAFQEYLTAHSDTYSLVTSPSGLTCLAFRDLSPGWNPHRNTKYENTFHAGSPRCKLRGCNALLQLLPYFRNSIHNMFVCLSFAIGIAILSTEMGIPSAFWPVLDIFCSSVFPPPCRGLCLGLTRRSALFSSFPVPNSEDCSVLVFLIHIHFKLTLNIAK